LTNLTGEDRLVIAPLRGDPACFRVRLVGLIKIGLKPADSSSRIHAEIESDVGRRPLPMFDHRQQGVFGFVEMRFLLEVERVCKQRRTK